MEWFFKRNKKTRTASATGLSETASMTECTGLIPTPPLSEQEADSYEQLYPVTEQQPI